MTAPDLPSRQQILDYIAQSDTPAGKREIAKAFGLSGAAKIQLKALLKDMADEGLIDGSPGRAFHAMGEVPKVTVLRVVEVDGDQPIAVPDRWEADGPPPKLRVVEKKGKRGALGLGDRILARTEERGRGWTAHVMKRIAPAAEQVMGVLAKEDDRWVLRPVEKSARRDWMVSDHGGAEAGELVLAEPAGRSVRVVERLGDPFASRSFSLVAIHKYEIPHVFPESVLEEAERSAERDLGDNREDLTQLPIVAIDPADARDHDDAIWAAPDDDPGNKGGFKAVVAIADVSFYVRPGSDLDREAAKRGNSVYFPDRVVPMLPEVLSAGVCSLSEGEDRAALACHLTLAKDGRVLDHRFTRARVRIAATIAYEDAQGAIDGEATHPLIEPLRQLWAAWGALRRAREAREPLELDLPERRVELDEEGRITSVAPRERLDAHRLVEDFMIAANVAAAKALEAKAAPVMYRVHEPPTREKLVALKDYLDSFDVPFALGQVIRPATFNRIIARSRERMRPREGGGLADEETLDPRLRGGTSSDDAIADLVTTQILRTQTAAYYAPANAGHFGLALGSYAHFTSPIRRYADLLVHRSLVSAYSLGPGGLGQGEGARFDRLGEQISVAERRAMEAERDTVDRYVAAFLADRVGEVMEVRITGVTNFGLFATIEGLGGDGLLPIRDLGGEFFRHDAALHRLEGTDSGTTYALGDRLELRLADANPVSGGLRFALPDAPEASEGEPRSGKRIVHKKRGRPANIRHDGKRRRGGR